MSQAVVCPVCSGAGKYYEPPHKDSSGIGTDRTCHGCGGRGWVEVEAEIPKICRTLTPFTVYSYCSVCGGQIIVG